MSSPRRTLIDIDPTDIFLEDKRIFDQVPVTQAEALIELPRESVTSDYQHGDVIHFHTRDPCGTYIREAKSTISTQKETASSSHLFQPVSTRQHLIPTEGQPGSFKNVTRTRHHFQDSGGRCVFLTQGTYKIGGYAPLGSSRHHPYRDLGPNSPQSYHASARFPSEIRAPRRPCPNRLPRVCPMRTRETHSRLLPACLQQRALQRESKGRAPRDVHRLTAECIQEHHGWPVSVLTNAGQDRGKPAFVRVHVGVSDADVGDVL
ncbi:hypothetical protein BJ138DRAFT_457453 [Hygrophoropsis aurantiaca]|uniref:Uncharacterized protein n=1 Tax=Hygrophoropsis aurantiaca TaxID=72124 RepID=A0ACB8A355_9AGAM|nr:hypothetical protein BJ138DRAFT_457453 [Hygrophoropsis aurantiaca]